MDKRKQVAIVGKALLQASLLPSDISELKGEVAKVEAELDRSAIVRTWMARGFDGPLSEMKDFARRLEHLKLTLSQCREDYNRRFSWVQRHMHHFGVPLPEEQKAAHKAKKVAKGLLKRVDAAHQRASTRIVGLEAEGRALFSAVLNAAPVGPSAAAEEAARRAGRSI
jgi:hypothetical protein